MLAVRRGGVDSVRQLVASMFLMETQVIINTINMIIKMRFMTIFKIPNRDGCQKCPKVWPFIRYHPQTPNSVVFFPEQIGKVGVK